MTELICHLLIGIVSGIVTVKLLRGCGYNVLTNIFLGVVGALLGGITLRLVGLDLLGLPGSLAMSTLGATCLLTAACVVSGGSSAGSGGGDDGGETSAC